MGRLFRAVGFAVLLVLPLVAYGQAVNGSLVGNVTDPSGFVLPGVNVTITEVNTNISSSTVTNESGYYVFTNLKDGTYRVRTELSGFKRVLREGVVVQVNATVRVDLKMEVGTLEESVTVTAESPMLQTDRADTGRTIQAIQLPGGAPRIQPEFPGHVDNGARRDETGEAAFRIF